MLFEAIDFDVRCYGCEDKLVIKKLLIAVFTNYNRNQKRISILGNDNITIKIKQNLLLTTSNCLKTKVSRSERDINL